MNPTLEWLSGIAPDGRKVKLVQGRQGFRVEIHDLCPDKTEVTYSPRMSGAMGIYLEMVQPRARKK
jgi:hypothetical protein